MVGNRKPSIYIPTLYIAEGLPYTIVNMMSVVFFKNLGASNEFIGLTSFLYIPWTIKLFWAPLVDVYNTRRYWILVSQVVLAILIAMVALGTLSPYVIPLSLFIFFLIALASATQDIAIDGFYMDALSIEQQAFYVGVRNAAYKIAWLVGSGGLVYLAGVLGATGSICYGWAVVYTICALVFFASAVFHARYLPHPQEVKDVASKNVVQARLFFQVFSTYFTQRRIAFVVLYILTFRLGDALMLKMAQPFLLDGHMKGGLAMSTADVGLIYGTVGTVFLLVGGILGGWLIARDGLRRWFLPSALIQNSAILLYWLLAIFKPSLLFVALANAIEQFAYGLGVAAYTVFLLGTVKPEFKAAHYAIATALMAAGVMLPGAASGYLSSWLGYEHFFLLSFVASLPGMVTIFFLPVAGTSGKQSTTVAA